MNVIEFVKLQAICIKEDEKFWTINESSKHKYVIRECNGIMVSYEDNIYILTCYHFIKNSIEIKTYIKNTKTEVILIEKNSCIPYDFSVLVIKNNININNISDNNSFCLNLSELDKKHFILNNIINDNNVIKDNKIRCEYADIQSCEYGTNMFPYIPSIIVKIANQDDYSGLSGTALCDTDGTVYGIVSYYDQINNNIIVLPSYCLQYMLDNIVYNRKLTGVLLATEICDFTDSNNMSGIGLYITTTYGINYYIKSKSDKHRKTKLNKGDLITKIDGKTITNDGKIYSEQLGIDIDINAYFMLVNNNKIAIEYSPKNTEKYINDSINKISFENYNIFDINQNKNIIKYNGLIITELSENLYKYYVSNGYVFSGLINWYYNNHIRSDGYKPVVIIDTEDNINNNNNYKHIGLPFIKTLENKYYLAIISKFDETKIMNLNQLKDVIDKSTNKDNIMKIYIDNRISSYKLSFNNNKLDEKLDEMELSHEMNKLNITT